MQLFSKIQILLKILDLKCMKNSAINLLTNNFYPLKQMEKLCVEIRIELNRLAN